MGDVQKVRCGVSQRVVANESGLANLMPWVPPLYTCAGGGEKGMTSSVSSTFRRGRGGQVRNL